MRRCTLGMCLFIPSNIVGMAAIRFVIALRIIKNNFIEHSLTGRKQDGRRVINEGSHCELCRENRSGKNGS
jgi:hypothetical protein